ncbi:SpoVR like family protein [Mariannaea sp. PMI_226]|nr:SpoVR like family protein [Mariannaea sp. PMI_226]
MATPYSSAASYETVPSRDDAGLVELGKLLTPELFQNLRSFWYEHLDHEDDYVLPKQSHNKRWFMGGKELDDICVERYAATLEAIRKSGATADDILKVAMPSGPLDWLSLILLLDQIPRNCYRGEESKVVFTVFDPIAQQIALQAIDQGIPDQNPEIRWHFAYRNWFYMPLMHSESLTHHELAMKEFEILQKDVLHLAEEQNGGASASEGSALEKRARELVQRDIEAAKKATGMNMSFEEKHYEIIKEFGRYPHRNKVLGRKATEAETAYLENGGETFGG